MEVLISIENVCPKLRRRTAATLREHRWLPPAATALSATALAIAVTLHSHPAFAAGAAASLLVTAFLWGYATRAFRMPPWPSLAHLHRRQYAETWDSLASSRKSAAIAVSGKGWEDELRSSAALPVRNLIELTSISGHDDLLEIGCGIGRIGRELASRCRSWTGADISANMLAYASERLQEFGNVRLQQLHGHGLSELPGSSFDVVYSTNMLAHLDEIDRWVYVQDAFRVLRPGGRIFLDNLDIESDQAWQAFADGARLNKDFERPPYIPRFSSATELMAYPTRAGFEQVKSHRRSPLLIVTAVKPFSGKSQP